MRTLITFIASITFTTLAPGQVSRVSLVRQSDIIFAGTVTRVSSPQTAVVRVDDVYEKPDAVSLMRGDSVTVEAARRGSLIVGLQATFYTAGWIFGQGITVREVGHEPIRAQVAGVAAAGAIQQDSVARARQQVNDANLKARLQAAAMVVVGRVEQVRPPAYTAAPTRPRRFTEHDPDWQEALIHVDDAIKGAQAGQTVVVRFPGSHDVAYVGTPKFTAGQEGTFLLQKDTATGSPLTVMGGQSVQAYTALHRLDVLTKQDAQRVRAVMRQP
ncbi:MAG TPA: hypothetical protein VGQ18_03375 [Gemmatimonadales bacterium]|jgi:hypothetical protein|nr:hypothetical protein [Gemmatimonadales bacterium]